MIRSSQLWPIRLSVSVAVFACDLSLSVVSSSHIFARTLHLPQDRPWMRAMGVAQHKVERALNQSADYRRRACDGIGRRRGSACGPRLQPQSTRGAFEPVKAARSGWARAPSFAPASAKARTVASTAPSSHCARALSCSATAPKVPNALGCKELLRPIIVVERAFCHVESREFSQVLDGSGPRQRPSMPARAFRAVWLIDP